MLDSRIAEDFDEQLEWLRNGQSSNYWFFNYISTRNAIYVLDYNNPKKVKRVFYENHGLAYVHQLKKMCFVEKPVVSDSAISNYKYGGFLLLYKPSKKTKDFFKSKETVGDPQELNELAVGSCFHTDKYLNGTFKPNLIGFGEGEVLHESFKITDNESVDANRIFTLSNGSAATVSMLKYKEDEYLGIIIPNADQKYKFEDEKIVSVVESGYFESFFPKQIQELIDTKSCERKQDCREPLL